MPIFPSLIERLLMGRQKQTPDVFVDMLATAAFRALGTARELGVLEALDRASRTTSELADAVKADPGGIERLLALLESSGYVVRSGDRWRNSYLTSTWLLSGVPHSEVDSVDLFHGILFEMWADLTEVIRVGRPSQHFHDWLSAGPGRWERFERTMRVQAAAGADPLARQIPVPGTARRLIDIAGGHGAFAVAFCRRYPRLTATIFDVPEAAPSARSSIENEGMSERIQFVGGDFTRDDLGDGYDVALLFRMLHYSTAEQNAELFKKVGQAVRPGGEVVVLDRFADAPAYGPVFANLATMLDLNYYLTLGGRLYSTAEVQAWLRAAGVHRSRVQKLRSVPWPLVVVGEMPTVGREE